MKPLTLGADQLWVLMSPWRLDVNETVKCYLLDKKIVHQSFYDAPLTFSYFLLQGKVLCFARVGKSLARCLLFSISTYICHKLFIQTVKCSFFRQITVYPSFYGVLLTFSYFLLQGKVLCFARVGKSLVRCLFPKCFEDLVENNISGYIWYKLICSDSPAVQ